MIENHANVNIQVFLILLTQILLNPLKDRWHVTPLSDAIRNGRVEIAKYLAAKGAIASNTNVQTGQDSNANAFTKRNKKTKEDHLKLPPLNAKTRI